MSVRCPVAGATSLAALIALGLSGCSTISDTLAPSKVDYRSAAGTTAPTLQVPPDLSQLSSDPRYQPPVGLSVSANAIQAAGTAASPATAPAATAAPAAANTPPTLAGSSGDVRIERSGSQRWLVVARQTPEQLWPVLRTFWQDNGFTLATDTPALGVMETDWAENRAKLPDDVVSRTVGKVFDKLRDSGERDRYRTRVERNGNTTEIYISHRGAEERGEALKGDPVRWHSRQNDPNLEAEMLARLMLRLSGQEADGKADKATVEAATRTVTATATTPARARVLPDRAGATLQIDDSAERSWRRLGLALDRSGFTVEDRNRSENSYAVRYVDPKLAGKEEPGFFSRMFGAKKEELVGTRYRLKVTQDKSAASSVVSVLNEQGAPSRDEGAMNIVQLLENELR